MSFPEADAPDGRYGRAHGVACASRGPVTGTLKGSSSWREWCLTRPVGDVGNAEQANINWGKAGRMRWKGKRPTVRGVAMNPVDHPHGGGEGKTSGGGHPRSPWGKAEVRTRKRNKQSDNLIVRRRRTGKKHHR